ncbi:MAG: polysaccharide biosynthesis/export family protein [Nitrococcus mobilis]|nr:polysaccharide biosynthesis/export family protein [Nitrococcus mobilis]
MPAQLRPGQKTIGLVMVALIGLALLASGIVSAQQADPESYRLGVGDRISVNVAGSPEFDTTTRIREDGAIGYPYLGTVQVGGLTLEEAESHIERQLLAAKLLRSPQVTVTVEQYLSRQVTVLGQVRNPKRYGLSGPSTVLDLIAEAGGRLKDGADYVVLIRRENGQSKRHILTMDALTAGNAVGTRVQADDVLIVPRMNVFYIEGAVQKSGMYRLEENMTVMQAIAVGGGLSPRGSYSRIEIKRHKNNGQIATLDAELDDILKSGDLLHVKERIF